MNEDDDDDDDESISIESDGTDSTASKDTRPAKEICKETVKQLACSEKRP